jgi:hypothetical protein
MVITDEFRTRAVCDGSPLSRIDDLVVIPSLCLHFGLIIFPAFLPLLFVIIHKPLQCQFVVYRSVAPTVSGSFLAGLILYII